MILRIGNKANAAPHLSSPHLPLTAAATRVRPLRRIPRRKRAWPRAVWLWCGIVAAGLGIGVAEAQNITPSGNITGSGATTSGNLLKSNNTGATLNTAIDTGIAATNLATLSGAQTISGNKTFAGANIFTSQNSAPPCPLTDAATIAVNASACAASNADGIHLQTVTLGGNRTLGFPSGLAAGTFVTFQVKQPASGGPYTLTLAAGYNAAGGSQPTLSTAAGAVDTITCYSPTGSAMNCGAPQLNYAPATAISVVSSAVGAQCSGSGALTCAASLAVTSGNTLVVFDWGCGGASGACNGSAPTPTSAIGSADLGTCTRSSTSSGTTSGAGQDFWLCPITGTGTPTVTVTWPSNVSYAYVALVQVSGLVASPDDGIGNYATGTSLAPSVNATGNTSQPIDLVLSAATADSFASPTFTQGTGQTLLQKNVNFILQYYLTSAVGTPSAAATISLSSNWGMGVLPLK